MITMEKINKGLARTNHPIFKAGDTVKVYVKIKETLKEKVKKDAGKGAKTAEKRTKGIAKEDAQKERIQVFEGNVIALKHGQSDATFTVRKISNGVGVERVFRFNAPTIDKIEVTKSSKIRRAKLYYLRDLKGKAARLKEEGYFASHTPVAAEVSAATVSAEASAS